MEQEAIYKELRHWIQQDITSTHPKTTILIGGDLQASPLEEPTRSHYAPLRKLCDETGLNHLTPTDLHTSIPAKTHLDHWLLRHTIKTAHYTIHITITPIYTPEYGGHKSIILELPQIGDIYIHNVKRTHINLTTRSHPPFILPIPQHIVDLYRLDNDFIKTNTQ